MTENKVYEVFFNTISESMDWASDDANYYKYVDGVLDMALNIIEGLGGKDDDEK